MNKAYLHSPIGTLRIEETDGKITRVVVTRVQKKFRTARTLSPVLVQAMTELAEYFHGKRNTFTVPTAFTHGTPFQQSVWSALRTIPQGTTSTYGDIAKTIGKPKAARAVGSAVKKNPILILFPCHRVIQKSGKIGSFVAGTACKRSLLENENAIKPVKK